MASKLFAVLTGDIQRSTELEADIRMALPERLRAVSKSAQRDFERAGLHPIDVFRGDSWQLLAEDPTQSLRIALYVRAHLRSAFDDVRLDTRVAVGIGPVDFVPATEVSSGDGEAFRRSGQALDAMGRSFHMAVSTSDCIPLSVGRLLDAIVKLLDAQSSTWTRRQAYAVARALLGMTQEEIGASWFDGPVSQQSIGQHLASAGWKAAEYALDATEAILREYSPYRQ